MQANPLRERNRSFLIALAVLALVAVPSVAMAQGAPWESTGQRTFDMIMSIARWVAMVGIVACGLAAFFGKLSWDWAGKIIIGLVLVFAAPQIVDYFRQSMGG
jgi:type IV secretion system protein VirB2